MKMRFGFAVQTKGLGRTWPSVKSANAGLIALQNERPRKAYIAGDLLSLANVTLSSF